MPSNEIFGLHPKKKKRSSTAGFKPSCPTAVIFRREKKRGKEIYRREKGGNEEDSRDNQN